MNVTAVIGAVVLVLGAMAYALSVGASEDDGLGGKKGFRERKELYRRRRDEFRENERAVMELGEWKGKNDDFDYIQL